MPHQFLSKPFMAPDNTLPAQEAEAVGISDFSALQSAIDSIEGGGGGAVIAAPQSWGQTFPFSSGIEMTPSAASLYGRGAILDFSDMTSGYALTLLGYAGDINIASSYHQPHEIANLHIVGPGTSGVGCVLPEGDSSGQVHKYQLTFRNVTFRNFAENTFRLNRDTWGVNWFGCHFRPTADCTSVLNFLGTRPDGVAMTNAGERMSLFGCTALNGGTFLVQEWGNSDAQLVCCSVDQFDCVADVGVGKVLVSGGHYENKKDNNYWFKAKRSNALISVRGADMYLPLGATFTRYAPFYSDVACRFGGINVDGLFTSITATYYPQTLCHGYGRAVARNITFLDSSPRPPFSRYMNLLPDGTDTKHLDGWTPMPGAATQLTSSDIITLGVAATRGSVVPATFAGRALVAADVGAIVMANSDGTTGMARIVSVNSATSAYLDIITTFTSATNASYYGFFPSDSNVPTKASGWSQPFTGGTGLEPLPGQTVTGATSGATMVVTSVKLTSGTKWGADAAGTIYGFSKTGSFTAGEAWQVSGTTFANVASGGAATTNYAMSFVGTGTAAQRFEKYIPFDQGKTFTMAYLALLSGCASVAKSLSVTVAYCDEFKQVIGSTQSAVTASSTDGFKYGPSSRANVTPAPAGTKFARVRFEASAASSTGGVISVGDIIINAL